MLFADNTRRLYTRSQLVEVICQLRFPTIPEINVDENVALQEAIKDTYPQYRLRKEQQMPKVVDGQMVPQPAILNHTFVSEDNIWKVNLTQNFIALSTLRYTRWEDFAHVLDRLLATFVQVYKPAHFERLGLRYMNAFSKEMLGFQDALWDDLINAPFIGALSEPDVDESMAAKSMMELDLGIGGNHRLRLHAGPGILNNGKVKESKPRFVLDNDFSLVEPQIAPERIADEMNTLHDYAVRLFNAATTQDLKNAMGATPMD